MAEGTTFMSRLKVGWIKGLSVENTSESDHLSAAILLETEGRDEDLAREERRRAREVFELREESEERGGGPGWREACCA